MQETRTHTAWYRFSALGMLCKKSRATVYVTKCVAVSVQPRAATNCTQEIPVKLNETNAYVDPITFVI